MEGLILFFIGFVSWLALMWVMNRNNCIDRLGRRLRGLPIDFWAWKALDESGEGDTTTTTKDGEVKFTPEQQKALDHIVETRLNREKSKYADYEDLKKKVGEYEKAQDAKAQKELEEARKYDEAKKGYETQINQHKDLISKKDQEIINLRISHSLTNEISKQGGYIEETIALLQSSAVLIDGNVFVKTKDANGIDVQLPIGEGVKRFLEARPHLVKSNFKPGGGGKPDAPAGGQHTTDDLNALNAQLSEAMRRGDLKAQKEISNKIRAKLNAPKT